MTWRQLDWRQLERAVYNIIASGDELLSDQAKVDLILNEFDKFENGGE